MRVLVLGAALGADHPRAARAVLGLAGRGHEVRWLGAPPSGASVEGVVTLASWTDLFASPVDVVIGGERHPGRLALAAWFTSARAMVIAVEGAGPHRWSRLQRWCWESVESAALVTPPDLEALRERPGPLDPERLVAWPAATPSDSPDAAHPDVDALERLAERLLARRRSGAARRAVFLDRDGTLIVERHYLGRAEEVELLPGVPEGLRLLAAAGYALVVVSNQAGVGRGLFPLGAVYATTARLRRELRREGIEIEAFYFCPHHPDDHCRCRKPGPEMLERAARDLRLALRESAMVGDKVIDVETGWNARALGILVRTGHGAAEERGLNGRSPDRVCANLLEAARWLASRPVETD